MWQPANPRAWLPNALTAGNLLCGFAGVVWVLEHPEQMAIGTWLLALGAAFDFFDGMVARMLRAASRLGKELDSLADLVTFGVLPGAMVYARLRPAGLELGGWPLEWVAAALPLFSALRLARFNTTEAQSEQFLGLPTPANGLFFAFLLGGYFPENFNFIFFRGLSQGGPLVLLSAIFSLLLVAPLPMFSLKFKALNWRLNRRRWVFIGGSLLAAGLFGTKSVPLIVLYYVLFCFFLNIVDTVKERKA